MPGFVIFASNELFSGFCGEPDFKLICKYFIDILFLRLCVKTRFCFTYI